MARPVTTGRLGSRETRDGSLSNVGWSLLSVDFLSLFVLLLVSVIESRSVTRFLEGHNRVN